VQWEEEEEEEKDNAEAQRAQRFRRDERMNSRTQAGVPVPPTGRTPAGWKPTLPGIFHVGGEIRWRERS